MSETNGVIKLGKAGKRLDTEAIEQGVWQDCPMHEGVRVRIRPAAAFNPRFRKALRARAEEIAERALGDDDFEAASWSDDPETIVAAVVADMDGLYDGEDRPVTYTPEIGVRLLSDPGHLDLREWIVQEALHYQAYYARTLAKRSGNSRPGSSGKKAGAGRSARTRS